MIGVRRVAHGGEAMAMARPHTGTIDGVRLVPLKKVVNERGHLMEVQRNDEPHFPGFGQCYITATHPGVVKAWYRHHRQYDQIVPLKGAVLLVLYDVREHSPTHGTLQEVVLSEDAPVLVQLPVGIWHGYRTVSADTAYLVHLNTPPYDPDNVDEDRLPPDDPRIPYRWEASAAGGDAGRGAPSA
jgi:dTDP-4-dehydrorhamnose 3,5-epimerase